MSALSTTLDRLGNSVSEQQHPYDTRCLPHLVSYSECRVKCKYRRVHLPTKPNRYKRSASYKRNRNLKTHLSTLCKYILFMKNNSYILQHLFCLQINFKRLEDCSPSSDHHHQPTEVHCWP